MINKKLSYRKQLCTQYVKDICSNSVTLKSGLKVTQLINNGTICKIGYSFLLAFHSNYGHIFSHLKHIQHQIMA